MSRCPDNDGREHVWNDRGFCRYCGGDDPSIDWENNPLEPGPVKIVPQSEERARAQNDADTTGIGFLVDLKRVEPCRVVMLRAQATPIDAEAIARIIIGPREPVPTTSKLTLRELQDLRWSLTKRQERDEALWIAKSILKALEISSC